MIDDKDNHLSIRNQCLLLSVNRSTFFYKPTSFYEEENELSNLLLEIWMRIPFYGYRRLTLELKRRGHEVNHKKVQRLMRDMKIQAIYPRKRTTLSNPDHKKYPYLLKELEIIRPNQVWSTDITYIRLPSGFVYLVAIIDVFSRKILSFKISNTMDVDFCLEMLKEALLKYGAPEIINTDQGSQFTSHSWILCVENSGAKVSMDGKGRWVDNVYIERFWRTLKYEHVFIQSLANIKEARESIGLFIVFYNTQRPHQSLNYKTPKEAYYDGIEK